MNKTLHLHVPSDDIYSLDRQLNNNKLHNNKVHANHHNKMLQETSRLTRATINIPSLFQTNITNQTRPSSPCFSQWAKCRPGNAQIGRTVLPIMNLAADSELGSLDSYSSFLVTICLFRSVRRYSRQSI